MPCQIQQRNLITMAVLLIVTLGFYFFYWLYQTKEEINKLGGKIPTFWFAILPFFYIYFIYRYAEDFVKYARHQEDKGLIIGFFLLLLFVPIIAPFIVQTELNHLANLQSAGLFGRLKTFFRTKH